MRKKRPPQEIKDDMRALLDQLLMAQLARSLEGIAYCKREIRACELELTFNRYGRTDVC